MRAARGSGRRRPDRAGSAGPGRPVPRGDPLAHVVGELLHAVDAQVVLRRRRRGERRARAGDRSRPGREDFRAGWTGSPGGVLGPGEAYVRTPGQVSSWGGVCAGDTEHDVNPQHRNGKLIAPVRLIQGESAPALSRSRSAQCRGRDEA